MRSLRSRFVCSASVVLGLAAGFMVAPAVHAEEPIPSDVEASEFSDFIDLWKLTIEVLGQKMELFLDITDVDGKVGATLDSAQSAEPLAIEEILAGEDGGLDMNSQLKFGGTFTIDIMINLVFDDGNLSGRIRDKGGIFDTDLVGQPASQEELDSVQGRRPAPTEARLTIDGKKIRIAFANLKMGSSDWDLFEQLEDGEVFQFTLSRATKIYTDHDLAFGDVVVEKENMAKDYPGVYSVWLKKAGDGWLLVFNSQADIWGSRYLSEHDVYEVPLALSKVEGEPVEKFLVKLEESDGGGTLRLLWGDTQWSAPFSVGQ